MDVIIKQDNNNLCISNEISEIIFDLQTGIYSIKENKSGLFIIENAFVSVNEYKSIDDDMNFFWSEESVYNDLGRGKALRIRCINKDGQEIIILFILYENKGFISFKCGFKNSMSEPVWVKTIKVFEDAVAFKNFRDFTDIKLLDGNSGAFNTKVLHGEALCSKNNAMLTFGKEFETNTLILGGLSYCDFVKFANISVCEDGNFKFAKISLYAEDPYGRRVDSQDTYFPDGDSYYLDFSVKNPHLALEEYGQNLRISQKAMPNKYQFPSVCLWYAEFYDMLSNGVQKLNTSSGAVEEMNRIKESGFLKYAPVAVRLVPDYYGKDHKGGDIQQGWWDDAHWQKYQSPNEGNGRYTEPFETTKKWAGAVQKLGGIPLTYFQTSAVSEDYARQFPGHMLFNNGKCGTGAWLNDSYAPDIGYDFSDDGFKNHMHEVYKNLKDGGVRGLMFNYPGTAWDPNGGFEDPYQTTAGHYISVFKLAKEDLGKDSYIHERGCETGYDAALGWVDSQRTEDDTADMPPDMVKKVALRWYKNRVVTNYDMDSKDLMRAQSDDELHTLVTMAYAVSGRLLIANSFKNLNQKTLYSLSRIYPQHTEAKSFRPIDAFTDKDYPQIFDFEVNSNWHQVIFYNGDKLHEHVIEATLSGDTAFGALPLDKKSSYYVYDFWNDIYTGKFKGTDVLSQRIRKGESRVFSIRRALNNPMVISANRHIMQGAVEMRNEQWQNNILSAEADIIADEEYIIKIKLPDGISYHEPVIMHKESDVDYKCEYDHFENIITLAMSSNKNRNVFWAVQLNQLNNEIPDLNIPVKPSELKTYWNKENFSLGISWKASEEYEYYIYANTNNECKCTPLYFLARTSDNCFIDNNISNHSCRNYMIVAKNKNGLSSEPLSFQYNADFEFPITFIGLDYQTKADWQNVYGSSGYSFRGMHGFDKLPTYIDDIKSNVNIKLNDNEKSGLFPAAPNGNKHSGYESNTGILSYTVTVNDHAEHCAAFYCIDSGQTKFSSEKDKRKMSVEIITASGKTVSNDIFVENFKDGVNPEFCVNSLRNLQDDI